MLWLAGVSVSFRQNPKLTSEHFELKNILNHNNNVNEHEKNEITLFIIKYFATDNFCHGFVDNKYGRY